MGLRVDSLHQSCKWLEEALVVVFVWLLRFKGKGYFESLSVGR